jgi:hypothetical protein
MQLAQTSLFELWNFFPPVALRHRNEERGSCTFPASGGCFFVFFVLLSGNILPDIKLWNSILRIETNFPAPLHLPKFFF